MASGTSTLVAAAGASIITAVGACLLAMGQVTMGAWMVTVGLSGSVVSVTYIVSGRRLWQAAANDYMEGRGSIGESSSVSTQLKGNMADTSLRRWVGAGTMPGNFGYMQATLPLVILEVTQTALTLRLRPRLLAKLTGMDALVIQPGDEVAITPVRSNATWQGIEIQVPGIPAYIFWTRSRAEILSCLENLGFSISPPRAN
jgi:hypothetical protein